MDLENLAARQSPEGVVLWGDDRRRSAKPLEICVPVCCHDVSDGEKRGQLPVESGGDAFELRERVDVVKAMFDLLKKRRAVSLGFEARHERRKGQSVGGGS